MNDRGTVKTIPKCSRVHTTNDQKLCSKYRELIGIVYSLTVYEQFIIGSDHFINFLKDHKTVVSCFTKKRNFLPILYAAWKQLTKFPNLHNIYTKGNKLSVADMLNRFSIKKNGNLINKNTKIVLAFLWKKSNSFVWGRTVKVISFSRKLKPFRNGQITKLEGLGKSPMIFWHRMEKHFTHIDIIWFQITLKNLCFFLTFIYTMKKSLKNFLILIYQTWFILYMRILKLMIMFLMMTHSERTMMTKQLCLIMKNTHLETYMTIIIISLHQNLILKVKITK